MTVTPAFDLLAARYLKDQDAAPKLRDLARAVAQFRENNPTPGQRSARKADLVAVASAAHRLRTALRKIDLSTRVEALSVGMSQQSAPPPMTMKGDARRMEPTLAAEGSCPDTGVPDASELVGNVASVGEGAGSDIVEAEPAGESGDVVKDITAHSRATMLADLARLDGLLATVERGFAAVSQGDELAGRNGAPVRHDALQMGLEGLKILWTQYRRDEATQSLGEDGFAALALAMFGAKAVGFDDGTVMGAVVDFLPRNKSERSADWDTKIFDAFCERALKL